MKATLDYALKLNPKLNPDLFIPDPLISKGIVKGELTYEKA
jgi:hypothetical protein